MHLVADGHGVAVEHIVLPGGGEAIHGQVQQHQARPNGVGQRLGPERERGQQQWCKNGMIPSPGIEPFASSSAQSLLFHGEARVWHRG